MQSLTIPKREPKRSRVFLDAQVDSGDGPAGARIRDISSSGALVQSDVPQHIGSRVRLTCGGVRLDARVAWVDDACFGLEFETPLLVSSLVDPSGSKLQVSAPRSYRPHDLD